MAKIDRQTNKQADGHGDSMTESAQGPKKIPHTGDKASLDRCG